MKIGDRVVSDDMAFIGTLEYDKEDGVIIRTDEGVIYAFEEVDDLELYDEWIQRIYSQRKLKGSVLRRFWKWLLQ